MFQQIESLYASIAEFESGGQRFRHELYEERFRGVIGLFGGLETDDRLAEVDAALHRAISSASLTYSGLRYLTSHILSIDFEFRANRGRAHRQAYNECFSQRRQPVNDAQFIRSHLVPIVLEPKSLGDEHGLRWLLLEHLASLSNTDTSDVWPDFLPTKQVERAAVSECFFQLMRRRLLNPNVELHLKPKTLEHNLSSQRFFDRLSQQNPMYRYLLEQFKYGYVGPREIRDETHTPSGGRIYVVLSLLSVVGLFAVIAIWTLLHGKLAEEMRREARIQQTNVQQVLDQETQR